MPRKFKRMPERLFYYELGRNLRVARSAAGKSQGEVAEHIDVAYQQIQKYEDGINRIQVDHVVSLAAYFEIPILDLIAPSKSASKFQSLAAQFDSKEFHRFMKAWGAIKDDQAKARLLDLIERMADLKC
jgi:transcriptional regulator with XRE-family HTH domain